MGKNSTEYLVWLGEHSNATQIALIFCSSAWNFNRLPIDCQHAPLLKPEGSRSYVYSIVHNKSLINLLNGAATGGAGVY
jgi:hypothetical protein